MVSGSSFVLSINICLQEKLHTGCCDLFATNVAFTTKVVVWPLAQSVRIYKQALGNFFIHSTRVF